MPTAEPFDIVYTWVDDTFPGYRDVLARYVATNHDRNPNRTRDNLDLLKYSLRSLKSYAPWVRRVFLVTCRPQIPAWLNTAASGLTIVHHDAFMDANILPVFNSFAIVSCLADLPGVSRRFLYLEDDMLFGRSVEPADFVDPDGAIRVFQRLGRTRRPEDRDSDTLSPWNTGLALANHLLDQAFGPKRRHTVNHVPLLIDRDIWAEMLARWPTEFARTRGSRFRAKYNVPPEYLYPHYLLETERGRTAPLRSTYTETTYHGLENILPWSWAGLSMIGLLKPKTIALNDNFGDLPNPRVVALARRFLADAYPVKSPYEL